MKHTAKMRLSVLAGAFAIAFSAHAAEVTVVNFGGANGDAQKAGFNKPFEAQTGNKVTVVEYNGEQAKIKAMVEAKHVNWDVVEVESGDIGRGCDEGLFEKLDWSKIAKKADLIPEAPQACGVGFFVWSTALVYNADKLKSAPTGWADFWDVKKFPGKRGMRKGARYNLEFALMADGVPAANVYKILGTDAGVKQAFKKLDQIKKDVVWWEAGAQPPQLLADGEVAMTTAYNGRIFGAAVGEGKPFTIVWDGQILDFDLFVIPKGAPNKALAMDFIRFSTDTQRLADQAKYISYGPARKSSSALVGMYKDGKTKMAPHMPTAPNNMKNALVNNFEFWADNDSQLNERFNAWIAAN